MDDRFLQAPWIGQDKDDKEELVKICACCDGGIYTGDEYYDIEGFIVCDACINDYKKRA